MASLEAQFKSLALNKLQTGAVLDHPQLEQNAQSFSSGDEAPLGPSTNGAEDDFFTGMGASMSPPPSGTEEDEAIKVIPTQPLSSLTW